MTVQYGNLRGGTPALSEDINGSYRHENTLTHIFGLIIHQLKPTYEYYIRFLPS